MNKKCHHIVCNLALGALLAMLVLTAGCSTSASGLSRQERKAMVAAAVQRNLSNLHFKINVNTMYPQRGVPKHLDYGYEVKVQGDSLYSYLPYFGRAYNIPYGGGKGLNFSERIAEKQVTHPKAGLTSVVLFVQNNEDQYLYTIEVFDNGKASVYVRSREREAISYSGAMVIE
jgi:hypothetical protein